MTRVFFAIIPSYASIDGNCQPEEILQTAGNNTGNFLFVRALEKQLKYDFAERGINFNPKYLNRNFDYIAIPAANWVNSYQDDRAHAERIEKTKLPCITVGLGAQSPEEGIYPQVSQGTVRLLKVLSERAVSIGVRGEFTAEVLGRLGVKNVTIVGCPSLFFNCHSNLSLEKSEISELKTIFHGTHFQPDNSILQDTLKANVERELYRLAFRNGGTVILQSEFPEILFCFGKTASEIGDQNWLFLKRLYGVEKQGPELEHFLRRKLKIFFKINEWINEVKKHDFSIGTRLHGTIISLISGVPAVLIPHDSRTAEMARYAMIPNMSASDFLNTDLHDIYLA